MLFLFQRRAFSSSSRLLAGHSKWANIKHDKAKNDAQKNKISNKLASAIAVAAKLGGPDPSANIRLAAAIELAGKSNVTKKVIETAIKRGAGLGTDSNKTNVETAIYEGTGPGGISLVVEALTDNKNRTFSQIRGVFAKYGGNLSPTTFQFNRMGFVVIDVSEIDAPFDNLFEKFIEIDGIEDIEEVINDKERSIEITTEVTNTGRVANELKRLKEFKIKEVGISYIPKEDVLIGISDEDTKAKFDKFIDALEDVDDITDYFTTLKEE